MRIEVEKNIDAETKDTWHFNLFDLNAVFVGWTRESKPKGKRKWVIVDSWDKYSRDKQIEPPLPEQIRSEALSEVYKLIRIFTYDEWKEKNKPS